MHNVHVVADALSCEFILKSLPLGNAAICITGPMRRSNPSLIHVRVTDLSSCAHAFLDPPTDQHY